MEIDLSLAQNPEEVGKDTDSNKPLFLPSQFFWANAYFEVKIEDGKPMIKFIKGFITSPTKPKTKKINEKRGVRIDRTPMLVELGEF